MAKTSSSKKVARVARTGGAKRRRVRERPKIGFGLGIFVIVVLGSLTVFFARTQRIDSAAAAEQPAVNKDHWHMAYGFYVCDHFLPAFTDKDPSSDPNGIHTHGDGVVHIHPFSSLSSGKRAKLQIFFDTTNVKVTASEIKLTTDNVTHKNGQHCDSGTVGTAEVQTKVWNTRDPSDQGHIVSGNPANIHPTDGMLITIAFVPPGTDIPRPPSADQLDKLSDLGTNPTDATTDTTVPTDPTASSTSTVPADPNASTTTSAPATSTTVPATTTTARP
jgi:hypothetical protein